MLYLVGGASRAGKSTLSRRLLDRQRIPYFSIDVLAMGLVNGWPALRLDPDYTDEAVLAFITDVIRFSRYLERECAALGLPYVDCSAGLEGAIERAHRHLTG